MNMKDIIAPSYIKEVESRLKKRIKGEKIDKPLQIEIIRKNGQIVPIEIITSPVIENNKLVAVQGVARDLTKYRKLQANLEETEKKWNALFSRSLDWIYIHDFKGRFLDANEPALNKEPLTIEGKTIPVSISIGLVSSYPHQDQPDPEDLLKRSDRALYRAKEKGRNRVEVA